MNGGQVFTGVALARRTELMAEALATVRSTAR